MTIIIIDDNDYNYKVVNDSDRELEMMIVTGLTLAVAMRGSLRTSEHLVQMSLCGFLET